MEVQEAIQEPTIDLDVEQNTPQDTVLFDTNPRIDFPLRIDPPFSMKVPERDQSNTADEIIKETVFAPAVFAHQLKNVNALMQSASERHTGNDDINKWIEPSRTTTSLRDYKLLSNSAERAGKFTKKGEGSFCKGILQDNLRAYEKAIECYKVYLEICENEGDVVGQALAHNCIGLDFIELAYPTKDGSPFDKPIKNDQKPSNSSKQQHLQLEKDIFEKTTDSSIMKYLENAKLHFEKHLDCCINLEDDGGVFVARTNLGIVAGIQRHFDEAQENHQEALQIGIKLQSLYAQSIAVGNLALAYMRNGQEITARQCLEQHLSMTKELGDKAAQIEALFLLGDISRKMGGVEGNTMSISYYDKARGLARRSGNLSLVKKLNCLIGLAQGTLKLQEHFEDLWGKCNIVNKKS